MAVISLYLVHISFAMLSKNQAKIVKSLRQKKQRLEQGLFFVEGNKLVAELLQSSLEVTQVFSSAEDTTIVPEMAIRISQNDMAQISALTTPPGLLAVARLPKWYGAQVNEKTFQEMKRILALDGLRDPGNLGTIIRTAAWFGFDAIVASSDTVDCFNPKVLQATMGGIFQIPIYYTELKQLTEGIHQPVFGLDLLGESVFSADVSHGVFMLGSESHGLRPDARQLCTDFITIPGSSRVESLNAAVSASIVMAEVYRRGTL